MARRFIVPPVGLRWAEFSLRRELVAIENGAVSRDGEKSRRITAETQRARSFGFVRIDDMVDSVEDA
jgi:hypothetical protein